MSNVIKFEKYQDVTGWSLHKIGDWVREHKWKGFVLHWKNGDNVTIERTT